MIAAARDALRQATLDGVRQIYGAMTDNQGGYCAGGVLVTLNTVEYRSWASTPVARCPVCDTSPCEMGSGYYAEPGCEWGLLVHLNNVHRCDFLKIAELMPVT